jgi:hypothetical protein
MKDQVNSLGKLYWSDAEHEAQLRPERFTESKSKSRPSLATPALPTLAERLSTLNEQRRILEAGKLEESRREEPIPAWSFTAVPS